MDEPVLSVLIATLGEQRGLLETLPMLSEQAHALGGELVISFNAEPDAVRDIAKRCSAYADRIVYEAVPGKSNALNTGIRACRGAVVAFTDDDARPAGDWLRELTAPLLDLQAPSDRIGCGGPVEPVLNASAPAWYRRLLAERETHFLGPKLSFRSGTRGWSASRRLLAPLGANCAFRRDVLEEFPYVPELGPNRTTGIRGGEDTLLGVQALEGGNKILYRPTAKVRHDVEPERMDRSFVRRAFYINGIERVRMLRLLMRPTITARRARRRIVGAQIIWLLCWWSPTLRVSKEMRVSFNRGVLDELLGRFDSGRA